LVDLIGIEPMTSSMPFFDIHVTYWFLKASVAPEGPKSSPGTAYWSHIAPKSSLLVPRDKSFIFINTSAVVHEPQNGSDLRFASSPLR